MNDPKTEAQVAVNVQIEHRRPIIDIRTEQGHRPYAPPATTAVVFRMWERESGQIIQYEGTLAGLILRQEPPTPDDLEWLQNIGALPADGGLAAVPFYDKDRETLREAGRLLDRLDAALADDDQVAIASALQGSRLTYLGGYLAGLADREPEHAETESV